MTQIYIGNIPYCYEEKDLRRIVGELGQIRMVKHFRDRGFAFIDFATHEQAQAVIDFIEEMAPVLDSMQMDIHGNYEARQLKVGWSKPRKMKYPHRRHQIFSKGKIYKVSRWVERKENDAQGPF